MKLDYDDENTTQFLDNKFALKLKNDFIPLLVRESYDHAFGLPEEEIELAQKNQLEMDEQNEGLISYYFNIEKELYEEAALFDGEEQKEHIDPDTGDVIIDEDIKEAIGGDPELRNYLMNKMVILSLNDDQVREGYINSL